MEVTVLEAQGAPSKAVLAVHSGVTRRQSVMDLGRSVVVPDMGDHGGPVKVALFQQLGCATLPADGAGELLVSIPLVAGRTHPVKLRLKRRCASPVPSDKAAGGLVDGSSESVSMKMYLEQHHLHEIVEGLIQEILRSQPENPYAFMRARLRAKREEAACAPTAGEGRVDCDGMAREVLRECMRGADERTACDEGPGPGAAPRPRLPP